MSTRFSLSVDDEQADAGRNRTAESVSRDQIITREREQEKKNIFPCSANHEQDWQPYPVGPYSAESVDHPYIHTSIVYSRLCAASWGVEEYKPRSSTGIQEAFFPNFPVFQLWK